MALLLVAWPALASHDKTDVVAISDGSSYVGAIKGVSNATVTLKTNAASTLSIEWRYVTGLTSKYQYRIELDGGILRYGSLAASDSSGMLTIVSSTDSVDVELVDVVTILPMERSFSDRFDGSVNFGFSYSRANKSVQYNLSADATYRTRKNIMSASGQSIYSTQEDADVTSQQYFDLAITQVIKAGWGAFEVGQLQANPDQGYDTRLIVGGGATHYFKENSKLLFGANLGLVYNREDVYQSDEVDETGEVLLGVSYRQFKHSSHSPTIKIALNTFFDTGGSSRYRFRFTSEITWKIIRNLTFNIQFTDNYDSDPPSEDAENNDFNLVTSIGFTF